MNKIKLIVLILLGLVIIFIVAGRVMLSFKFTKEVKTLFAESKDISGRTFHYNQLNDLPPPVKNYFKHVLRDGQPYISYVRLKHEGFFKTDRKKDWMTIKGEQYYTTENPGFVWKGNTLMFSARDMYISGKGRLVVSLLSCLRIAEGSGEKYDQGELLRWLGESVWFPTNLLPDDNKKWTAIDSQSAQLTFTHNDIPLTYVVSFNTKGEITQLQTKRYMGDGDLETWIGKLSNYKEMNGVQIPMTIEALYRLKEGDYSYAKFHITHIEYNKAEMY